MRDSSARCVEALLNSAADTAPDVRETIIRSLTNMSLKDPLGVLQRCEQWLSSHKPSTTSDLHRYVVIKAIISVLLETVALVQIPGTLRDSLITLSVNEMTATNDLTSEWAHEACRLCVELMSMFPKEGCNFLIEPMNSQQLPHFYVIEALANFAELQPLRFVPFLKEAVSKLLPIMSLAKQDNHRMLIAKAMGNFADSILHVGVPRAEPLTPRSVGSSKFARADFFDVMYSGIQFLTGDWSRVSELRVRVQVGFAMGTMFAVCSDDNRVSTAPKLLPLMMNALKKEKAKDQAPVSRGFANMLSYCSDALSQALVPHLDGILTLLLQCIIATNSDKEFATHPALKKNLGFLLSACEQIATFNMDGLIVFVSKILDAKSNIKDPMMRSGCLQIFRHLLSRPTLEPRLRPFVDNIIATLKLSIADSDWRVRRTLASCVVAMGSSEIPFFAAVGGTDLLTYVIRNASISDATIADLGKKDAGAVTVVEEVRDMCRNTLTLFSSSQGKLDQSLWPFLFEHMGEYVNSPTLINAFPTICRCLGQLGHRVCETENYYIDFDVSVNVPKPAALTAKFLTQCLRYDPMNTGAVLEAMSATAPLLDEPFKYQDAGGEIPTPIGSLWLGVIPELEKILAEGKVDAEGWEDLVCKLVSKTMVARGTETWPEEVSQAALVDLPAYAAVPELFRACIMVIGIGVGKCSKKDFVERALEGLIDMANHENPQHRAGLAKAFGYIASQHTDAALEKLALLAKGPAEKKGLFSSSPKTAKKELVEASRIIAAGGLTQSARRMPQTVLPSRLDASIFPTLMSILVETKSSEVREGLLDTISTLENPIKKLGDYNFRVRDQFIESIIRVIPVDPVSKAPSSPGLLKHVLLALKAITSLFNIAPNPAVPQSVQDKVTQFIIHFVQRPWTETRPEQEREATLVAVETIRVMLHHNAKMPLDETISPFLALTTSQRDYERHRATLIAAHTVGIAAELTEALLAEGKPASCTATVGTLLGRFVPRFMDASTNVRIAAAEGLASTMSLINVLHREMVREAEVDIDGIHADIDAQKERVLKLTNDGTQSSEKEAASITKSICGIIVSVLIDEKHFSPLLDTLLQAGLTDPQTDAANCSSVVMHGLIRGLGQKLPEVSARKYFEILVDSVAKVTGSREQVLNGILVSIRNLVKHHTVLCFNSLLKYPTPHADNTVKAFHAVASDSNLSSALLQHCLDTVLNSQLHEDVTDPKSKQSVRTLAPAPLAAACGAGWICQTAKGAEAAGSMRGAVFSTLALYLTAAHDMGATGKAALVANAMRYFLECTSEEITVDRTERVGWATLLDSNHFLSTLTEITKFLCREEFGDTNDMDRKFAKTDTGLDLPPSEPTGLAIDIAQFILPYMNKPIRSHRRCSIACASALLRHCVGEPRLLLSVITGLQGRCGTDEGVVLRAEALTAFKGLTCHPYDDIIAHMSPVLGAQLANFSDGCADVAEAAMASCYHILTNVPDKSQIAPNVINIILKTKALFENSNTTLRKGAYRIFSYVVEMTNEGHMDMITMSEQIHLHHATVMMHMEDDIEEVRDVAKGAFGQICKFIVKEISDKKGREEWRAMADRAHLKPGNKLNIEDFFNEFCGLWVRHCPGRVNDLMVSIVQFFGRERDCLRMPAVTACGYFLKHLAAEDMTRANVDQVCNALVAHLNPQRERNPHIRARAAKSLGLLCSM